MKYLVLENHLSYSVLLSEDGQFVKSGNFNYKVGDTVTDIILLPEYEIAEKKTGWQGLKHWFMIPALALIALVSATLLWYQSNFMVAHQISLEINPSVSLELNSKDEVIKVIAKNSDGEKLIDGYKALRKKVRIVVEELIQKAYDTGSIVEGTVIHFKFDEDDQTWSSEITSKLQRVTNLKIFRNQKIYLKINNKLITTDNRKIQIEVPEPVEITPEAPPKVKKQPQAPTKPKVKPSKPPTKPSPAPKSSDDDDDDDDDDDFEEFDD